LSRDSAEEDAVEIAAGKIAIGTAIPKQRPENKKGWHRGHPFTILSAPYPVSAPFPLSVLFTLSGSMSGGGTYCPITDFNLATICSLG